jgi:hypothetical protein
MMALAIKALSPAINDPTTAVQAIDQIEDLLRRLATCDLETCRAFDEDDILRVIYQMPTWEDYLALAFDEIRQFGSTSIQVMRLCAQPWWSLLAASAASARGASAPISIILIPASSGLASIHRIVPPPTLRIGRGSACRTGRRRARRVRTGSQTRSGGRHRDHRANQIDAYKVAYGLRLRPASCFRRCSSQCSG